jgi:hypothetical protein
MVTVQTETTETKPWQYQSDDLCLTPYQDSVNQTYREEFLAGVYAQLKVENTLDILLPGLQPLCLNKFVAYFHDRPMVLGTVRNAQEDWDVAGFGWLFQIEGNESGRRGNCGYAFFRKYWGTPAIRQLSRWALSYWFNECKMDVIFGAALATNVLAQRFDRELGFTPMGVARKWFPTANGLRDAVVVSMTKEEFNAGGK